LSAQSHAQEAPGSDPPDDGRLFQAVSDGTAVLGLGDIGPAAATPVMEGNAMLSKEFAGVDAFPLCTSVEAEELLEQSSPTSALALAARFVLATAGTASLDLVEEVLVGVRA
jgi:malic enzyme